MIKSKNTLLLSILILLLFSTSPLRANDEEIQDQYQESYLQSMKKDFINKHGNLKIGKINITGLHRTQKRIVTNTIKITDTTTLEDFDSYTTVNNLKKKGIFSDINLSYTENNGKADINLHLEDKWTLIPIPMIASSENSSSIGLILLETNFLGLQKILVLGGTYSSSGNSVLFSYSDPSIFDSNFIFSISSILSKSTITSKTYDNDVLYQEYKARGEAISIILGYKVNDNLKLIAKTAFKKIYIDKNFSSNLYQPENYEYFEYASIINLDLLNYTEYFNYGFNANFEISNIKPTNITKKNTPYQKASLEISYYKKMFKQSRLKLDTKLGGGNIPFLNQERKGGEIGFMALASDTLPIKNYTNYTITMEHPIYTKPWGMVTFSYFWEQGIFNGGIDENLKKVTHYKHYYAPGINIQMYLKNIAVPAIGFSYAKNLATKNAYFKFVAGLSI